MLDIKTLGPVNIQSGGRAVSGLPSRAAEALLIYLACNPGEHSREKMAEMLWYGRSQKQSLANLRTILSSLRKALGDYLHITRQTLAFNHAADYDLDVEVFLEGLTGQDHDAESTRALVDLFQGPFLADFSLPDARGFEEWRIVQRERVNRIARSGLLSLTRSLQDEGDFAAALSYAEKAAALDPYDEQAARIVMRLLVRTGRKNAALLFYRELADRLKDELGVLPAGSTTALIERIKDLDFPPGSNLPAFRTVFFGRKDDLAALERMLLSDGPRLLTITGLGGAGKTRFAVEAVRRLFDSLPGRFLDGVFFIPLTVVPSADALASAFADALDLSFQGAEALDVQLVRQVQDREYLLVLDNFEHLLAPEGDVDRAVQLLIEILDAAPQTKLLVTSRERLGLLAELVFDLSGLQVPAEGDFPNLQLAAPALFMQTARRSLRAFEPSPEIENQVAAICRVLDGHPLAIELAASWIRQEPPAGILAQITESLDYLRTHFRDVPDRQRSIRTVFEHSWQLLTPNEQTVFAQLAVFKGGFSLNASKAILRPEEDAPQADQTLQALADKSLLQVLPEDRFDLHPLILQFAAEKLTDREDLSTALEARHADFYLDLLSSGDGESPEHRARIRTDLANIRSAWIWSSGLAELSALDHTTAPLHGFYSVQSWFHEGIDVFQQAVDRIEARPDNSAARSALLCDLWGRVARMFLSIGDIRAARAELARAEGHLEHVDDPDQRSEFLGYLAITHFYAGDYEHAAALAEKSLALSLASENADGIAFGHNFLGSCYKAQGTYKEARKHFEQAVWIYRDSGDGLGAAMALNNLGNLALAMEEFEAAQNYYAESTALFKENEHIHGAATTLANAGRLARQLGQWDEAREMLNESLHLKEEINDRRGMAVSLGGLGDVALDRGEHEQSQAHYFQALALADESGDVQLVLDLLTGLAALRSAEGALQPAARILAVVLAHSAGSEEVRARAEELASEMDFDPEDVEDREDLDTLVAWIRQNQE